MELNETPCISLEKAPPCPKSIITSRTFGHPITDIENLREAVISFVSIAAVKLRKQEVEADNLNLYIATGPFDEQSSYSNNRTITLPRPTASTPDLIEVAMRCLKSIYRPGYRYRKAGVMLAGIVKQGYRQQDLFSPLIAAKEDQPLMAALDKINDKWGRRTIQYGMTRSGKALVNATGSEITSLYDQLA
jgi:DNA polymerase V